MGYESIQHLGTETFSKTYHGLENYLQHRDRDIHYIQVWIITPPTKYGPCSLKRSEVKLKNNHQRT